MGLLAVVVVFVVVVPPILSLQFQTKIEALRKIVIATQTSSLPDQNAIPEMMKAFALRNGGTAGGPPTVSMSQSDQMRSGPDATFFELEATQLSGTRDPGFVWEATAIMAAVLPMRVVDSHVGGKGWLEVRIAGAIPVASERGSDADKGEIIRFLAELAWNPDGILNATGLRWRQIDPRTIEVSIDTTDGVVAVRQTFDADGDIVAIETDDRPYQVDRTAVPTRWVGRFWDYAQFGRYRLPRRGEVAWVLPRGEFVYFRGIVTAFGPTAQP
ncbi:MAG: DUF6544 family protein [Devosia sp.]